MQLPSEAIIELQDLYRKEYGHDLDRAKATKMAEDLMGLLKAVYIDHGTDMSITRNPVTH